MSQRGISFSAPMVRAIIDGHKTVTRRPAWGRSKPMTSFSPPPLSRSVWQGAQPGDRLWVREDVRAEELPDGSDGVRYRADDAWIKIRNSQEAADRWLGLRGGAGTAAIGPWRLARFMPRWCSRITLDLTSVRMQRLKEITDEEAIAEGIIPADAGPDGPVAAFARLWDSIHGPYAWACNPEVVVLGFLVTMGDIDRERAP